MGLLITPSGIRLPFSVSYYTEAYCKAKKIAHRKQTELAAQLIRQLPLPPEAHVVVLGDTAFDAEAIRTACEERKFSWIVPINPERVLAGEKPRPKVSSLSEDLTADQMVCLKVHPGKGKYVDYRRISRYRIGPKFKPRTYYVHEESRDVHSVGKVLLFFSTTKAPAQGHRVEVQKTLMTNDEKLTLRDVIELYQLRWQIELFFKELKSTLGLHHYRFKEFEKAETWVKLCLVTFVYLEWIKAHKLKQKSLKKKEREWWQVQRTYGLALAVRQEAEQRELKLLAEKMETPTGRRVLAKQLRQSHPKEYPRRSDRGSSRMQLQKDEAKFPRTALSVLIEHLRAGNIAGHQVGRELDAVEFERERLRQRVHHQRLCQPGNPLEDAMPASEDRHQELLDDIVLADDLPGDLFADLLVSRS